MAPAVILEFGSVLLKLGFSNEPSPRHLLHMEEADDLARIHDLLLISPSEYRVIICEGIRMSMKLKRVVQTQLKRLKVGENEWVGCSSANTETETY